MITANRMKIPPEVWGPIFWHTIHITALGYPSNPTYGHKKAAKEFYESLVFLIPCPVCRQHYETHLQKNPLTPHLDRRDDLFRWTVNLHNEVNTTLGKPRLLESEVIYYYRRIGARGKSPVINQDTLDELDMRSMIKGGLIGGGAMFALAAAVWYSTQKD
ncbi:MAG: hypothetical protein EB127_25435 [Alphaproteobacteria bacterium]|jgi:hypothetical protein|nr:hypothetical protein [Alphaproteobacteria bacterium]